MDRETEMYHAAMNILSNRAEQLGIDEDEVLMHKVDNSELLNKKERMLNQSKWERNRREGMFRPGARYGKSYNELDLSRPLTNPDLNAEMGKHGYVDSKHGRFYKEHTSARDGKIVYGSLGDTAYGNKRRKELRKQLDDFITDDEIRNMYKNGITKKQIFEHMYNYLRKKGFSDKEDDYDSGYVSRVLDEKINNVI